MVELHLWRRICVLLARDTYLRCAVLQPVAILYLPVLFSMYLMFCQIGTIRKIADFATHHACHLFICCYLMLPYVGQISRSEHPIYSMYAAWRLVHVQYPTSINASSWELADDVMFVTSFIGSVHPLYAPTFNQIILSEKHKSICNLDNIRRPRIISYLLFPCESSTWKFHVIPFVTSISGITIYTLLF